MGQNTPVYNVLLLNTSANSFSFTNLAADGVYSVNAFDGSCTYASTFTTNTHHVNLILTTNQNIICIGESVSITASGALTYSWNTGATGSLVIISPSISSTFSVIGNDTLGCSNTKTILINVSQCLSEKELSKNKDLRVFPNPINDFLFFESQKNSPFTLIITNFLGETIIQKENFTPIAIGAESLDVSELPSGIYFLQINNFVQKFIKE